MDKYEPGVQRVKNKFENIFVVPVREISEQVLTVAIHRSHCRYG